MKAFYLMDGNSLLYRAFYATPYLANSKGVPTNATYAFTNMVRKILKERSPSFLLCVFDSKVPSFRVQISESYKAQRPPMPSSLSLQIPYVRKILEAMGIRTLEMETFEADDLIASIVKTLKGEGRVFYIVTNDKDMMQLVDEDVFILDTMKDLVIGPKEVRERFGIDPKLIPDFLALAGDAVDNIPGVPGIGEKGARTLVGSFGPIESIYENLEMIKSPAMREKLERGRDLAFLSKRLALIRTDLPLPIEEGQLRIGSPDIKELKRIFRELEFVSLVREIRQETRVEEPFLIRERGFEEVRKDVAYLVPIFEGKGYGLKLTAFALSDGDGCVLSESVEELFEALSAARKIVTYDLKPLLLFLKRKGKRLQRDTECFDVMLASHLLNPLRKDLSLEGILEEELDAEVQTRGREGLLHKASLLKELEQSLRGRMDELSLSFLFSRIEMPLVEVLSSMEFHGVLVRKDILSMLSKEYEAKIEELKRRIYEMAGGPFNINSQQQLSHVLFDVLRLSPSKKTKKGYSTDTDVLKELSKVHRIASLILEYRALSKLKSTYIDTLPGFIDPDTGRIHTRFDQTTAATGRIISSDPNLQNIPIRGEEGKRVRSAFIADEGFLILSADYSQIELRILAHISGDNVLREAFLRDEDIHAKVAQELFNVDRVTEEMRRTAKVVNFGVVYGMSGFGLSKEVEIPLKDAERYIEEYFKRHEGVKQYVDRMKEEVREKGFVRTLLGRIRYIPEIRSPDPTIRQFGERMAINTPIQGTAADVIKLAMIDIHRRIEELGFSSRLIMQIHDELVLEVKEEELESVKEIVKTSMEGAVSLSVPLKVKMGVGRSWAEALA